MLVNRYIFRWYKWREWIIFLIHYFTKPFLIFVIGVATKQHKSRKQVKVSTLLFGYSRRLRHQEKLPNGRWRCESPFGTLWTENLQTQGKNSSKRCAMVSAPSQSLLRTGALQNFPGGPGGCRLMHYSRNIQIISKNYNLFFDFKSPKNLNLRHRNSPK